jgi:hypothetical protein
MAAHHCSRRVIHDALHVLGRVTATSFCRNQHGSLHGHGPVTVLVALSWPNASGHGLASAALRWCLLVGCGREKAVSGVREAGQPIKRAYGIGCRCRGRNTGIDVAATGVGQRLSEA